MTMTAAQITAQLRRTGIVTLDAGEYPLSEAIQVPSGATLAGQGYATRLLCTGDFPAITLAAEAARPQKVTIRNLRITRTNTLGAVADQLNSDGIRIWGTDITVEDVWSEDCYKHIAVVPNLGSPSSDVRLRRIRSSNTTPTVHNSHSGIYLGDVNRVWIEEWPSGSSYYPWLYPDPGEDVTNVYGVARLFTIADIPTKSATAVHAAVAGTAANAYPGPITNPTVPRTLTATFGAGWDGGNIRIDGTDQFDQAQTQFLTANAGATVVGLDIFKTVTSIAKTAVGVNAATCSIGTENTIGIAARIVDANGVLLVDDVAEAVTVLNDSHGFQPTTAPNGAHDYKFTANVLP